MFGNWIKHLFSSTWWQNRGPVTRTDIDKARQTVDTICRLKARVALLERQNAIYLDEIGKLRGQQYDNH